jgi:hypothetical protein
MWNVIKAAIGKHSNKMNFPTSFFIDNKHVSNTNTIASSFNSFFSDISMRVSQNVPSANRDFSTYLPNHNVNSMFLDPIVPSDILDITKRFQPKTSSGADGNSTKLLMHTIDLVVDPITYIVNLTFQTGIFPNELKTAKVIFKSGDPCLLNNYRPISLLSFFSKIFECVMYNKLMQFFNENDLFHKHQYGFRARHSTIDPILHLLNYCAEANNSSPAELTLAIFCDLSKAFDTISHAILLSKLNIYGVCGLANDWIRSYLSGRSQYVDIESVKSSQQSIQCGVPQGSILGPLLFLISINDIHRSVNTNILSFADDTTIVLSHFDPALLFREANTVLDTIFNWFCSNKLSLNAPKTQYIIIQRNNNIDLSQYNLYVNGVCLSRISECKFLGITIDEALSWRPHISRLNSKISNALFAIKHVFMFFLPRDSLGILYFSLIHSHLTYGILAWGTANTNIIRKTGTIQKRAIRIINNSKYNSHSDPLFKRSGIFKLKDQHQLEVMIFMHNYLHGRVPDSFRNLFSLHSDNQMVYTTSIHTNL